MNRHVFTLLFVTLVWGATFPVLKLATAQLSGVEISALRFFVASACMAPFAIRASRQAWMDGGAHLLADAATVVAALAYALYVIVLSQRTARHTARALAATQILWMSLYGGIRMLADARHGVDGTLQAGLMYLGVAATAGMLFLQALAQRFVSADKAALIYALEPVFAALFAWGFLSEVLTMQGAIGGTMVVGAVILSEYRSGSDQTAALSASDVKASA